MRAQRPSLAAAGNPVLALLFLWVLSWGHVTAEIDIANMTALQKHVSFFDRNKDGIITPSETIEGVVAIGCDFAFARDLAASVHAGLGPKTSPGKIHPVLFPHSNAQKDAPLPHLSIYINNIYRGMHRSDTGALDAKGRFVPAKFEEIFSKHAKNRPDALTSLEVKEMILANRDPDDPQSWAAPIQEWGLIYGLASDKNGYFHKDSVRGIYDGSVFVKLEEERASSQSTVCRSLSFRSTV
uniref:EF-hand domain-containing protein n=1 Tax=Oryza rufipogon TaxID=4529 RepID=A0A0E0PVX5_ORYRU